MIRIDPNEFVKGTLGAKAPDLTDPNSPSNNPFNVNKDLAFYEVEMNVPDDANAPLKKPDAVSDPGKMPTAFSMGISEPPVFEQPTQSKRVINDLFPTIEQARLDGAPQPRTSALDKDFSKTVDALPDYMLHAIDKNLTAEDVQHEIEKLEAYIDIDGLSVDEFCEKYGRHLRFDPVERTPRWEEIWYDVEEECDRRTKGQPRGMGFCFAYWSAKCAVLKEYGIDWKSPHMMNPRVMFD